MPEDLKDKLMDFTMMLEGFVSGTQDMCTSERERTRITSYWISLFAEIEETLDK